METLTNLTNTATKAIWGDGTAREEPISGVTGDVAKGEPYDAGNIEHVEHRDEPATHDDLAKDRDAANASEIKDSSVHDGDLTKAQNDTRDPSDPHTNPEEKSTQAKSEVDDTTEGPDTNDNPVKVEGPGPKPIADIAKEHGGDAGKARSSDSVDKNGASADVKEAEDDDEEDGPQKKSHGEGTGELYVKSSGLKADGGDFDAAAPGAGREADRLLEQKGFHREENGMSPSSDSVGSKGSSGSGSKEKLSLKDKIKAKLHKSTPSA
jgi:hypothetical protein